MAAVERVSAEEARAAVTSGRGLLVCAYDNEAKCQANYIAEAISLQKLREIEGTIPKDREIIFY
jgi:hypothetical protein